MHALMFQMKRAHLRALVGARAISHRTGLTPARHDLLRVIEAFGVGGEAYQKEMWKALGLSRASVSKMVRRLLALGLLQRRRGPLDGRTFLVSMTPEGERCMFRAHYIILKRRPFQRRFERAFGDRSWKSVEAVQNLVDALEQTARHLGDTSAKLYLTKAPAPPPMLPREESPRDEALAELEALAPPSPRALERARLWEEAQAREYAREREREREATRARASARAARRARARARHASEAAAPDGA